MITRHRQTSHLHGAVVHNGVVYASGHAAKDLTKDIRGQTQEICDKLDVLLAECGSDKSKLLSARIYLSDMSDKPGMNEVWTTWLDADDLPARATIGGADLGDAARRVEIVVIAAQN